MSAIRDWLAGLGLEEHAEAFEANAIGLDHLGDLDHALLKDIGVAAVGHRVDILKAAQEAPAPAPRQEAERRQITVMFCDLVGSTALAEALDPEDLRALMGAYQETAGAVIARYDGHVAQYLGDGIMVYFGWPSAHEDDAERAVRAALDIAPAVAEITAPRPLAVRSGIATGAVVVGESEGTEPKLAVGETPNLAARLQGLAGESEIVVAPSTRRLIGGTFELDDLGEQALKGINEPVRAWRVAGVARTEGRFEARGAALTPLIGRDEELGLVLGRWQRACEGEGQVVLLSGEPGIGKSRIVQALRQRLADEPHARLRYQCSPYHTNSAFYPIVAQIEHAAGFARDDSTESKLGKLEALLGEDAAQVAPLLAAILSLETGERYPPLAMSPQKQKEETLKALAGQVARLAAQQPLLMIFEDAHWIDPTSQEVLDLIVPLAETTRLLLVITYRPEYEPPWQQYGHVTPFSLNRLGGTQSAAMIGRIAGGTPLSDDVLAQIVAKSDGVPLFVEELTRTVMESGAETANAIPDTLQDSLMARLDRLSPVKEVAQIGACIGREFSYELLAAVSGLHDNELQNSLTELTNSALVFRHGTPPEASYVFKHALVQDAAYESLLKSTRQQRHTAIAEALEARFADQVASQPELVAHHYTRAGLAARAVPFWLRAGEHAVAGFANQEAISHLERGLDLLTRTPDTEDRSRNEIALRLALGPALIVVHEYVGPEIEANFKALRAASEKVADSAGLAASFLGLHRMLIVSGEVMEGHKLDIENLSLAETLGDDRLLTTARWALGASHLWLGHLATAQDLSHAAFRDLTFEDDQAFIASHLEAPGVTCRCFNAYATLLLGYPEKAHELMSDAVGLAGRLEHPFVNAFVHFFHGVVHWLRGEASSALRAADAVSALCAEHEMPIFPPMAQIFRAWSRVRQQSEAAAVELERARDAMTVLIPIWQPMLQPMVIECEAMVGSVPEAIDDLDRMLAWAGEKENCHSEAELKRMRGELELAAPGGSALDAERWFQDALAVAGRQQAKWWELRAATSLAKLWQSQGKAAEARELLAPVTDWFTEGFDTADLTDAKALLDAL